MSGGNVTAEPPFNSSSEGDIIIAEDIWLHCEPVGSSSAGGASQLERGHSSAGADMGMGAEDEQGAQPWWSSAEAAADIIRHVCEDGGHLLVLTGAGMSVSSGVPVFRHADGSMSPDFLRFLGDFNTARRRAGLPEADDWFGFSVS